MHKHNLVRPMIALLASLLAGALPAQEPAAQAALERARDPWAGPTVEYRLGTGAMSGVPVVAGRTVRIRFLDQNPLCYAYAFDVKPRLASIDVAKLVAGFGSLPSATAVTTPPAGAALPVPAPPPPPPPVIAPAAPPVKVVRVATVASVQEKVAEALGSVETVRSAFSDVEAALGLVEKPTCDGSVPLSAIQAEWDDRDPQFRVELLPSGISAAQAKVQDAQLEHTAAKAYGIAAEAARLVQLDTTLRRAGATLDSLRRARPELARRTARASAIVRSLVEVEKGTVTEVFVPQGSDTLHLGISRRELHPADGKTASPVVQTVPVPVRNGMRFFLSVGAMASGIKPSDYQRVNRQYADTTKGIYSTYENVLRRRTLAFSPVLQGNVALRDVHSSGVSFLGSAGIAVRSVNGSTAPEFLTGVGLSFLDRFVWTGGVHIGRRERLLLGNPTDVASAPVSDKITEASAIGVEWRPALVTTFSVRLN